MSGIKFEKYFFALPLIFLYTGIYAQDKIELVKSDAIIVNTVNNQKLTRVIGNVHWYNQEREIHIYCDTTETIQFSGIYKLKGNVIIQDSEKEFTSEYVELDENIQKAVSPGRLRMVDSTGVLTSDRGYYDLENEIVVFESNVKYYGKTRYLETDKLEYDLINDIMYTYGKVMFEDFEQNALVRADSAIFYSASEKGELFGNPSIAIEDSTQGDSLHIVGDRIEYFGGDTSKFYIYENVSIYNSSITANSNYAFYNVDSSIIYLRGNPEIISGVNVIKGEEIDITLFEMELKSVEIRENAVALSPADSTGKFKEYNKLYGQTLYLEFLDRRLSEVVAVRNATSVYYIMENDENNGVHEVTGEQITITFIDGNRDKIRVENGIVGRLITIKKKE